MSPLGFCSSTWPYSMPCSQLLLIMTTFLTSLEILISFRLLVPSTSNPSSVSQGSFLVFYKCAQTILNGILGFFFNYSHPHVFSNFLFLFSPFLVALHCYNHVHLSHMNFSFFTFQYSDLYDILGLIVTLNDSLIWAGIWWLLNILLAYSTRTRVSNNYSTLQAESYNTNTFTCLALTPTEI